jgi:hypothetical protein
MIKNNPYIREGEKYNLTILSYGKYELECYVFGRMPNEPSLYIRNMETDSYNFGSDFFRYDWYIKEIKEDLIPTIDEVVERNWGDEILGNNIISAIIDPAKTYFTSNHNLSEGRKEAQQDERMQLDTKIFREIAVLWLAFLESQENQKS